MLSKDLPATLPRIPRITRAPQIGHTPPPSLAQRITRQVIQHRALVIPVTIALLSRAIVLVAADLIMRFVLINRHSYVEQYTGPMSIWQRKDAIWYVAIAQSGYNYSPVAASRANFFPLFPLLVHIVEPVFAIFPLSDPYVEAGMLVTWVAFALACVGLYRLAAERFGERVAVISVLLLALFPFSLYYGAVYTESIYLVLAVWAFIAIEHRNWWMAGALAGLASASRPPGLLVGACVGLAYLIDWYRMRRPLRFDILALALAPAGTAAYMLYCWVRWGDALAYVKTSHAGWGAGRLQFEAVVFAAKVLRHPISLLVGARQTQIDVVAILLMVCFLALSVLVLRLLGPTYAFFTVASILTPVLDMPTVNGFGRYLSVLFPVFMVVAYLLRGRPWVAACLSVVSGVLLIIFASWFIGGYGLS
jgi:hypothetical protein